MADIRNFPDLDELENRLGELFKSAVEIALNQDDLEDFWNEIRSIKLDEIIIFASWANDNAIIGETQLNLGFIFTVPEEIIGDRDPAENDNYITARNLLGDIINEHDVQWDTFNQYFDGFDVDIAYLSNRDEFISFKINITDSVQAYSLTKDVNITITEGEPEFTGGPTPTIIEESKADARVEEEIPPEDEDIQPNDIIEFPNLNELRLEFETTFRDALLEVEGFEEEQFELNRIIIDSPWGDGTAEFSRDPLTINYIILSDIGSMQFRIFANRASNIIEDNITLTNTMLEWFDGIKIDILNSENVNLIQIVGSTQGNRLFDLLNNVILRVENNNLIEDPLEEPEEEIEQPEVIEEEPEELPVTEREEPTEAIPEFPEVPDPLQPFAISPDKIDVPVGKETKTVEPREIYEWEMELASPQGDLDGGIGEAKRVGGEEGEPTFGIGIPPATFPRTGSYIKYHLLHEGPSYVLEMYNDLVIYSAFISTIHNGTFKPGTYNAFRVYLNRIRLIGERGGPQLIKQLSPQQASARGLETLPDHPDIEGEKAPWLERRIYYEIIEENINHDSWNNIAQAVSQLTNEQG